MPAAFECFTCRKVTPLTEDMEKKCASCGKATNGQLLTAKQYNEMFEAGAIWNINPKTGGPAKKKKLR